MSDVWAEDIVDLAIRQTGDRYVLGAFADPSNPDPSAFDCSELVRWVCARLGVVPRMPDLAFAQAAHCRKLGTTISIREALWTRGALLFVDNGPGGSGGRGNHVAISLGDGMTIEARSTRYGVGSWTASGRNWNYAALIPGVRYGVKPSPVIVADTAPTPAPVPLPPPVGAITPDTEAPMSNIVVPRNAVPNPDGRWPHYRLDTKGGAFNTGAVIALNGARRLAGDVPAFGVFIVSLPERLAAPVTGMVEAPDGSGVIVTAADGGTFHYKNA